MVIRVQRKTLNIAEGFNSQLTNSQSHALAENNSKFNIQNSIVRTAVSPKDICTAYLEDYFYAKHASR